MKQPSPTQATLARVAGVSQTTVSLALRGHPSIPENTRARIHALAEQMGYKPNPLVSALMRQLHSKNPSTYPVTLAWVTSFPTRDGWRERRLFRRFHEGACDRAMELGYAVEEFWLREPGMTGQRFGELLEKRSICGVILAPLPCGRGHIQMDWGRFCLATINYSLRRPALHRAAPRQTSGVSLAVRHLRRLGYNRIGMALPLNIDARANHNWSASFLMNRHRLAGSQPWPLLLTRHWNERQFGEWFRSYRPEVVMSTEEQVYDWLRRLGARVPEDAGFVNLEWSENPPGCCGIRPNAPRVGAAAVDLVVEQLEHNERGLPAHPKTVLIDGEWVPGTTVVSRPATEPAAA